MNDDDTPQEWDHRDDVDPDKWDDGDDEWDDEASTVDCPYCSRAIHEDALRCPYCENYISTEDSPAPAKPWWIILGAVAALYAVLRWVV